MPIPFPTSSVNTQHSHSPASTSSSLPSYPSSLDSESDASSDTDTEAEIEALIQEEWEESLRQLELVVSIVVLPTIGKWYGRMWSYWAWARYQRLGVLGRAFFGLSV
ncbi:uncharacterized protein IL334_001623 [Kwoniella shivajii]|uniref:Uncharacterized protein n=1 Tax=Kwoniella shivajii TaxID=564305 RepID=A0ABZ1CSF4_9TREE|nr:hypothetical protein IL334_001623 [Kwoniella shivajii]